jgi:hypothetical protein
MEPTDTAEVKQEAAAEAAPPCQGPCRWSWLCGTQMPASGASAASTCCANCETFRPQLCGQTRRRQKLDNVCQLSDADRLALLVRYGIAPT